MAWAKEKISEYDLEEQKREKKFGVHYKWIALSNTTLGALMVAIDSSILIISLPAVFNGLGINPLASGNVALLLWLLLGYTIVSCVTVSTIGRLSDMFGRVRLYNIGFVIFSSASIAIWVSSYLILGSAGVISITILRLFQGLGGSFLFANSTAILTDAFPPNQRGMALGINSIAFVAGSLAGLLIGGVLAAIDWHLIFLISVPVGIIGTVWAYMALHELASLKKGQKLDILGNVTFAVALVILLSAVNYGILPYNGNATGWSNPLIEAGLAVGILLLAVFAYIETKAEQPMFQLSLFKIKAFTAGNLSMFLSGLARGGLQFMLIIWLQGIWLPLHGVSFENTPLQAGIDMIPLIFGLLIAAPIFGRLSDRYGPRFFTTFGMLLNTVGFLILATFPANFNFIYFAITLFVLGLGQGMFTSPNTSSVMSAVPPEYRGITAGVRATLFNTSFMFSLAVFFSLLIIGLSSSLPHALYNGLIAEDVSPSIATQLSQLPPSAALFAALLGYNPLKTILPQSVISSLPQQNAKVILGNSFFPTLISGSFMAGMQVVMYTGAVMAFLAAVFSALRGKTSRDII